MKYKVGDRVMIRKDLKVSKYYGGYSFVSSMGQYAGKEAEIIEVRSRGYFVDIDSKRCVWTDEMLEDKKSFTKEDLQNGMKVIFKDGKVGWVMGFNIYDSEGFSVVSVTRIQDDLKHVVYNHLDIMEVYHGDELVYKREENENQEILDKISELEKQLAELKEMV